MQALELISALRDVLNPIKESGCDLIQISSLESYLTEMEKIAKESGKTNPAQELEKQAVAQKKFELDVEAWKINLASHNANNLELFKSVIESGQTALRSAHIINGGAAAALLAFMSGLLTKKGVQLPSFPLSGIGIALLWFVIGLGCAGISSGLRYLTQFFYAKHITAKCPIWIGHILNAAAILFGIASFGIFFIGGIKAYFALRILQ